MEGELDLALCLLLKNHEDITSLLLEQMELKVEHLDEDVVGSVVINIDLMFSLNIIEKLEQMTEEKKLQYISIVAKKIDRDFSLLKKVLNSQSFLLKSGY